MEMIMRSFSAALIVLLMVFTALPAQENMGRGRLTGQVVDESGAAVPDAKIVVQSLQGDARLEGTTDKKGRFAVAGMGTGQWRITITKEGYSSATTDMRISQLKPNPPLTVTLSRVAGAKVPRVDEQGQSLLDQGNTLLEEGKFNEALAAFEQFSAKYPEIYAARLNVATAYLKMGDLDRAESEFRGVLDKAAQVQGAAATDKETTLRALSGLGELALKRGDFTAAQESFRKALEISPEDAAAAYNVGEIFFSNQKIDEAIAYFELAIRIKKDWPKAYYRLGFAYLNKGDYDKALENLRKFIELDPQNPEAANVKTTIAAVEKMKK
jgi:tetratricopeptide (TPR) repeat protein